MILLKDDYDVLMNYLKTGEMELKYDHARANTLIAEIEKAELLSKAAFPKDVVRLHSRIVVRDKIARRNFAFTLVLPEDASHREDKISILAPLGTMLLGARKGADLVRGTAGRKKYFTIMEIIHPID